MWLLECRGRIYARSEESEEESNARSAQIFCLNVKFSRFQMEIPGSKQELTTLLNPRKRASSDIIGENEQ